MWPLPNYARWENISIFSCSKYMISYMDLRYLPSTHSKWMKRFLPVDILISSTWKTKLHGYKFDMIEITQHHLSCLIHNCQHKISTILKTPNYFAECHTLQITININRTKKQSYHIYIHDITNLITQLRRIYKCNSNTPKSYSFSNRISQFHLIYTISSKYDNQYVQN